MALGVDGTLYFGTVLRILRAIDSEGGIRFDFGYLAGSRLPAVDEPVLGQGGVAHVSRRVGWQIDSTYALNGQGECCGNILPSRVAWWPMIPGA
jgi:hypothetical protein